MSQYLSTQPVRIKFKTVTTFYLIIWESYINGRPGDDPSGRGLGAGYRENYRTATAGGNRQLCFYSQTENI
jgi:hypothetical protein